MKSGEFFRHACLSGLWPEAKAIHRTTLTKARRKVDWTVFQDILRNAVDLAYQCWPQSPAFSWHGMSVFATDGSRYDLPPTEELRQEFDPQSGLQYSGKGHYPQCLVSTIYDVFRRLPIARTVVPLNGSEREEAKDLVAHVPAGSVVLFDRGYPSYGLIRYLQRTFKGRFVFRCPAQCTFPAVEAFIRSGKEEDEIWIAPSGKYLDKVSARQRRMLRALRIRVVKLRSPDGTLSVLLTNLYSAVEFPREEIVALYFRRWEVEGYYRDEKMVLELERFHGKSPNSIRQELFAAMIMTVIARSLMALSSPMSDKGSVEPQFKNAIMTLASEAAVLSAEEPQRAIEIFSLILKEIHRVKYYRPKSPRPSQPRVTKKPINKWADSKRKKMLNA